MSRKERKRARKEARADERRRAQEAPAEAANEVRNKCEVLNQRLAKLEKYITSSRYQLDREIRNL